MDKSLIQLLKEASLNEGSTWKDDDMASFVSKVNHLREEVDGMTGDINKLPELNLTLSQVSKFKVNETTILGSPMPPQKILDASLMDNSKSLIPLERTQSEILVEKETQQDSQSVSDAEEETQPVDCGEDCQKACCKTHPEPFLYTVTLEDKPHERAKFFMANDNHLPCIVPQCLL